MALFVWMCADSWKSYISCVSDQSVFVSLRTNRGDQVSTQSTHNHWVAENHDHILKDLISKLMNLHFLATSSRSKRISRARVDENYSESLVVEQQDDDDVTMSPASFPPLRQFRW